MRARRIWELGAPPAPRFPSLPAPLHKKTTPGFIINGVILYVLLPLLQFCYGIMQLPGAALRYDVIVHICMPFSFFSHMSDWVGGLMVSVF